MVNKNYAKSEEPKTAFEVLLEELKNKVDTFEYELKYSKDVLERDEHELEVIKANLEILEMMQSYNEPEEAVEETEEEFEPHFVELPHVLKVQKPDVSDVSSYFTCSESKPEVDKKESAQKLEEWLANIPLEDLVELVTQELEELKKQKY